MAAEGNLARARRLLSAFCFSGQGGNIVIHKGKK
jgi:hypothetical protein